MGIDTEVGGLFFRRDGRNIRHMQKHHGINLDFRYCDTETGYEFDIRELPDIYIDHERKAVNDGDLAAHRRVITRAIDDSFSAGFRQPHSPTPARR